MSIKINLKVVYCYTLATMPILSMYGFAALSQVSLSEYILMIFCLIDFFKLMSERKKRSVFVEYFPVVAWMLIQPILASFYLSSSVNQGDAFGTAYRLAWYYLMLSLLTSVYSDKEIFLRALRFVGVLSSIYGILQYIAANYFRVLLSPYLPFLTVIRLGIEEVMQRWTSLGLHVRARAWFSEPASFALYLILCLAVELFVASRNKHKAKFVMLYCVAIVVSGSSTGMIGTAFLLGLYAYRLLRTKNKKIFTRILLAFYIAVPIIFCILYCTGIWERFVYHTFAGGRGLQEQSHFIYIETAFGQKRPVVEILFGSGMQDTGDGYLPAWFRILYDAGICGFAVFLLMFFFVIKKGNQTQRILALLFVFLNAGTQAMMGSTCLLYFTAISMLTENPRNVKQ